MVQQTCGKLIVKGRYKSLNQAKEDGAVTMNVGVFLNTVFNFVVISIIIFTFVRTIEQLKRKKAPTMKRCYYCFSKIDQRAIKCSDCTADLLANINHNSCINDEIQSSSDGNSVCVNGNDSRHYSSGNDNTIEHLDSEDNDNDNDHPSRGNKNSKKVVKKNLKKQLSNIDYSWNSSLLI